ncbi:hypothetical protein EV562_1016 [Streptomyces sp. BK208]|nr:hypothetical protein EV562_1016 [Streptomyces sp. BK208]
MAKASSKYLELAERLAETRSRRSTTLVTAYGVAPNTVSRAVQVLKERGLLSGKPGGTTRVPADRVELRYTTPMRPWS